ncbi:MAG: sensor histidine kinase [Eubacterium sp.]
MNTNNSNTHKVFIIMRKISSRIFINIFFISVTVLLASTGLTLGLVYEHFSQQNIEMLENEIICLKEIAEEDGIDSLDNVQLEHRITVINEDGSVEYDSKTDTDKLGNHLNREEVKEALNNGKGYAERYSSTLSEKTVNVAVLLSNGTVLRISDTHSTVFSIIFDIVKPLFIIFAFAIACSFLVAYRISHIITKPINEINLTNPDKNQIYEELEPLVNRIQAQNQQICDQMEELRNEHEKQDKMRREFTANVSHELKTPLTSISGFAEIIQNGIVKEEDIERFAGKIHDESQRLITLVGDIIKLSQLDEKEIEVKREKIDLYNTCEMVLNHLAHIAEKKNIILELDGEHAIINGVEQIIEEMIFNLCDNAIKYNKDGGRVNVKIRNCVDGIEVSVKDTGIGIPKEDLGRIFERFYRVDKSHSKEIGGTGLGLSIVKHGAIFHGASLSVDSEVGIGTTVRILF